MILKTLCVALCVAAAPCAQATQHLVSPGQDWAKLASRIRAGDEIILMPGRHVPASLSGLQGEFDKRIVIRGMDAKHPALIQANECGIQLLNPRFVTVQDVAVVGATECAIRVHADAAADDPNRAPVVGGVTLQRISIDRTGPDNDAVPITLHGLQNVQLKDVTINAWGGYGIDIVGCQEVRLERCTLKGHPDYPERDGVVVRGGSRIVAISNCTFEECGNAGISVGAETLAKDYRPIPKQPRTPREPKPSVVQQVEITECLFIGSDGAVELAGVMHARIARCTVDHPSLYLVSVRGPNDTDAFADTTGVGLEENLFIWRNDDLPRPILTGANIAENGLAIYENLWWAGSAAATASISWPVEPILPQIVDVNPALDAHRRPTDDRSVAFGWKAGETYATVDEAAENGR